MQIHNIDIDTENTDIINQIFKGTKVHPERLMVKETYKDKIIDFYIELSKDKNYLFVFSDIFNLSYLNTENVYQPLYYNSLYVENYTKLQMNMICNCYLFVVHDILNEDQKNYNYLNAYNESIISNNIFLIRDQKILDDELCDRLFDFIDKNVKQDVEMWTNHTNVNCCSMLIKNIQDENTRKEFDDKLFSVIGKVIEYLYKNEITLSAGDCGYNLRKIYGPTRCHSDNIIAEKTKDNRYIPIQKIRNMAVIMALNGDYEGGEFYFPVQNYKIKLNKGDIIAFPPYWTHPYMVNSPSNGTYRYTVNTWLYQ